MIRRPPRSTLSSSSAASDVYKRQPLLHHALQGAPLGGGRGQPRGGNEFIAHQVAREEFAGEGTRRTDARHNGQGTRSCLSHDAFVPRVSASVNDASVYVLILFRSALEQGSRGGASWSTCVQRLSKKRRQHTAQSDSPMSCLLYTSPSPRDRTRSRMPSSA